MVKQHNYEEEKVPHREPKLCEFDILKAEQEISESEKENQPGLSGNDTEEEKINIS
jgi:hypothetical protein